VPESREAGTVSGIAESTFSADSTAGVATVSATVDNETLAATVDVVTGIPILGLAALAALAVALAARLSSSWETPRSLRGRTARPRYVRVTTGNPCSLARLPVCPW